MQTEYVFIKYKPQAASAIALLFAQNLPVEKTLNVWEFRAAANALALIGQPAPLQLSLWDRCKQPLLR